MTDSQILYLVSAEKFGKGFWKVGTSKNANPLDDKKTGFLECYRKELLSLESALEIQDAITINVSNIMFLCQKDGFSLENPEEGFSYDLPLVLLEDIYDFWLDKYKKSDNWYKYFRLLKCRRKFSFSNQFIRNGLIGNTAKYALAIEHLHSYRPLSSKKDRYSKDPMWI